GAKVTRRDGSRELSWSHALDRVNSHAGRLSRPYVGVEGDSARTDRSDHSPPRRTIAWTGSGPSAAAQTEPRSRNPDSFPRYDPAAPRKRMVHRTRRRKVRAPSAQGRFLRITCTRRPWNRVFQRPADAFAETQGRRRARI